MSRFSVAGEIDLRLVDDAELFDTIVARFDGNQFWFDEIDPRTDPAVRAVAYGRIRSDERAESLDRPALAPGHRIAYLLSYNVRLAAMVEDERTRHERRLRGALETRRRGAARLHRARDEYRVTYEVDGQRHVSVVRKDNLTVQTAGICLSGRDRDFDLASLVGVLRDPRGEF
jgi:hypothetical protein